MNEDKNDLIRVEIYNFVKCKPGTSIDVIAENLQIEELKVLKYVNELQNEGYVTIAKVAALDISVEKGNSVYYKATHKPFIL